MKYRLIEIIKEFSGGNKANFAELCGVPPSTLNAYTKGKLPKPEYLIRIFEECGVNITWLLTGIGPKYITDQGEAQTLDPDPEIAELMEGARRVLTSGNPIAFDALERNIRYFDHAIAAEKRADASEKELQEMKDDVEAIKKQMAELKKQQHEDGKCCQGEQSPDEKAA